MKETRQTQKDEPEQKCPGQTVMEINYFILKTVGSHRTILYRSDVTRFDWHFKKINLFLPGSRESELPSRPREFILFPAGPLGYGVFWHCCCLWCPCPSSKHPSWGSFKSSNKKKNNKKAIPVHVLPLFSFKLWLKPGSRSLKAPEKKIISMVAVTMGNLQTNSHPCTPQCPVSSQSVNEKQGFLFGSFHQSAWRWACAFGFCLHPRNYLGRRKSTAHTPSFVHS